jgi:glycerophosphoryl diester phosphodiesterase
MNLPLVVAHRGYSARYAENTLVGCNAAIEAGADLVEADARFSRDGTLFCFHDADLKRLAGRDSAIAECGDDELTKVRLKDGHVPATIPQMLAAIDGRAGLLIDVKIDSESMVDALAVALASAGWPENVWLGLRSADQVAVARRKIGGRARILAFLPDTAQGEAFLTAGADALRLWEGELGLPEAARLKMLASIWVTSGGKGTARAVGGTDAGGLSAILRFGPDAILVNDPAQLVEARHVA